MLVHLSDSQNNQLNLERNFCEQKQACLVVFVAHTETFHCPFYGKHRIKGELTDPILQSLLSFSSPFSFISWPAQERGETQTTCRVDLTETNIYCHIKMGKLLSLSPFSSFLHFNSSSASFLYILWRVLILHPWKMMMSERDMEKRHLENVAILSCYCATSTFLVVRFGAI